MNVIFAGLFGLLVGSFLNAWICRMEAGESIIAPRSRCPNCGKILSPFELIPIFSYIIQKGRCRGCKTIIAVQYLIVELVTAFLFSFIFWRYGSATLLAGRDAIFICALIILFIYDLKHSLVPDKVVIPAAAIAFTTNILMGQEWQNLLLAIAVGAGFFLVQFVISRGRWIGGGDIRIGAMMGAMLGWPLVLLAIFISYILGSLVSFVLLATGKASFKTAIPLGTFLTLGTAITLWWGEGICRWYLGFIGL